MRTRAPSFVGGDATPGRATAAGTRPAARRQRVAPLGRHDDGHWTARKSVLVAISGASALWSALFVTLTLFRG